MHDTSPAAQESRLTRVVLDGVMGLKFGREWKLSVSSAPEALRLIDANAPGLRNWIRENKATYAAYRVVCTYEDGHIEELDDKTFDMLRNPVEIRFTPVVSGAGGIGKILVGAVLIAMSFIPGMQFLLAPGISMMIGGAIEMLSPRPNAKKMTTTEAERQNKSSYYFNGAVNTVQQGVPVQLIYGRCLVGSHVISANLSVDQLI